MTEPTMTKEEAVQSLECLVNERAQLLDPVDHKPPSTRRMPMTERITPAQVAEMGRWTEGDGYNTIRPDWFYDLADQMEADAIERDALIAKIAQYEERMKGRVLVPSDSLHLVIAAAKFSSTYSRAGGRGDVADDLDLHIAAIDKEDDHANDL
jgi:hypothetical protein